jgi:hypothetical protein
MTLKTVPHALHLSSFDTAVRIWIPLLLSHPPMTFWQLIGDSKMPDLNLYPVV